MARCMSCSGNDMRGLLIHLGRVAATSLVVCIGMLAIIASGGGGDGDEDNNGDVPSSGAVTYSLGAPNASLGQSPMTVEIGAPVSPTTFQLRAAVSPESFTYPSGPDSDGDDLPKISGEFDTLTYLFTQALNSKLWLDLPTSAGGYQVAVAVTDITQPLVDINTGELSAGELVITPRKSYPDLPGRIHLTFSTTATPVCIGWDSNGDGSNESNECMSFSDFDALWQTPDAGLSLPDAVQQGAAAGYAGWALFYEQFGFSVAAMKIVETYYSDLQNSPADTVAATISCEIYPPTDNAGDYSLSWHDRNGSGSFDTGDDVRLAGNDCFSSDDFGDNAGNVLSGTLELRGFERNVGAAPTFIDLAVTRNKRVGSDVVAQDTLTYNGGFVLHAPGIVNSTTQVEAYVLTADNMTAAASLAASTTDFYPDITTIGYSAMNALRGMAMSPDVLQELGLCSNGGTSTLIWQDGSSPNTSGLSEADTATLTLTNCDMGTPPDARIMDGTLAMTLWGVAIGDPTAWAMASNVMLDLQTITTSGSARRLGEFSFNLITQDSNNYEVTYSSQSAGGDVDINGVLSVIAGGQLAYQLGCFQVTQVFNPTTVDDYELTPNSVVKSANRIFSIGTHFGDPFQFRPGVDGNYPDAGSVVLLGFSAPVCEVLGVPPTGLSGGDNSVEIRAVANDAVDNITLTLYELNNPDVTKQKINSSWSDLH